MPALDRVRVVRPFCAAGKHAAAAGAAEDQEPEAQRGQVRERGGVCLVYLPGVFFFEPCVAIVSSLMSCLSLFLSLSLSIFHRFLSFDRLSLSLSAWR